MTRPRAASLLAALTIGFLAVSGAPGAVQPEQSPADLRAENDRLREEVERLRGEIAQRDREIERQKRQIDQLRDALQRSRAGSGPTESPADDVGDEHAAQPASAPVPDDPFASPASMLQRLRNEHVERFNSPNLADPRARQTYLQELRAWARDAARTGTGPVEWRVRTVELADASGSAVDATFTVIDGASALPVGEPFTIRVTGRNAARLRDAGAGTEWILDGVLRTEIPIDEQAPSEEMSGGRAFVGPFALFTFDVAVRSLRDTP